ncbi:calcium:proton antiporter [Ruania albidiflava]|uniref:calcium:proton antiporter n=1 Tax=Ruania albidiflava TaxID=366586 RepID=UPI0003B54C55|nr:calcium:proton antiporter [Ruania albidiflava]
MSALLRSILTPAALARLAVGWSAVLVMALAAPLLTPPVPALLLIALLAAIIAVILGCAFGVVGEAEHLARRLGDPYGSLVLTLSIVTIEVILISAVMLGPGVHTTIARDSVLAVSMIILNLVVGLCLLVGGLRHGGMRHNRTGTSAYLAMIVVLASLAFALPAVIGVDGSYTPAQEIPIVLLTVGVYAFFLFRQMGAQAGDFREVDPRVTIGTAELTGATQLAGATELTRATQLAGAGERTSMTAELTGAADPSPAQGIREVLAEHRGEVLLRLGLLVTTVLPIVLLSQHMAALLDDGLGRLSAPTALSGVLIAMIVFLPESITSVRAALGGEIQRVNNLCHGGLVSTVGVTIPSVLVIGLLTGQQVVLAESPVNLLLLGVTAGLSVTTFSARRVTAMHGAAHLVLFAVYGLALFS